MKRDAIKDLYEWKKRVERKPLMLLGARQVGKTWLMKAFAKEAYEKSVYVNLEDDDLLRRIFEKDFDVERILMALQLASGVNIDEDTLIMFDEIQEAPRGVMALKYFYEKAPQYQVMAAGSLLGVALHAHDTFPVGKVEFLYLYPLSFDEFLMAVNERWVDLLRSADWDMMNAFQDKLVEYLRQYYYVGGMPEVVDTYVRNKNFSGTLGIQKQLLNDYEEDITKYVEGLDKAKVKAVYNHISTFLAKENKRFQITKIARNARNRDYIGCVEWLADADVINICYCLNQPELPLKGNYDPKLYKIYFKDTGLLIASLDEEAQEDLRANKNLGTYKGAIYENIVGDMLAKQGYRLFYYRSERPALEMDFFVRDADSLVPVEVKASDGATATLNNLLKTGRYPDVKYGIKLGYKNIGFNGKFYTFPYFLTFLLKRFLSERKM